MSDKAMTRQKFPEEILARLKEAQGKFGYIPAGFVKELAESFDIPVSDVYGVASFYSFLCTKPLGRNIIRVCKNLPCYLKKSQVVAQAIETEIGIRPGQTTPDGRFSFQLTNCIGLCDKAPAMLINNDPHVDLTPGKIAKILQEYK